MNPICNFIEFINDLTNDEFSSTLEYIPSKVYFKNGGCYELVKTLQHFLPDSGVYLSNDFNHCAFFYKGILYDTDGIIEDINEFHPATEEDLIYLNDESFYGRIEIKFNGKNQSEALIETIKDCRIDSLIERCQEAEFDPYYYKQNQK